MITLEELEQIRIKLKNKILLITGILFLIILIFSLIFKSLEVLFFGTILAYILSTVFTSKNKKDYVLKFKKFFVKSALEKIFTNIEYKPNQGMPRQTIASTNMMHMGDLYDSNDLISGKYKDIGFRQADVHIQEERESTDSDGNKTTYYVTLFKGRWMIFDFNKEFKADLQVVQKWFGNNKVDKWKKNFEKIKMESVEFNKRFKVYAENDHEAFYILTPHIMEKIITLDDMNKGKLLLCFINNKLHIGLNDGNDSFEHCPIYTKINEEEVRNKISTDIKQITMFIDELDLDNDLFRKEAK